MRNRRVN